MFRSPPPTMQMNSFDIWSDLHDETVKSTTKLQNELASNLTNLLTAFVFGICSPVLLTLAVTGAWLKEMRTGMGSDTN